MKRLFLLTTSIFLLASSLFFSQVSGSPVNRVANISAYNDNNEKKTKITEDQLPQAVKDALTKGQYASWKVGDVYLVTGDESEYYKIELKNGNQKETIKLDRNGNPVTMENKTHKTDNHKGSKSKM